MQPNATHTKKKDIQKSITSLAETAYLKLMRTAYEMTLTPSMPHNHSEVLEKFQRQNDVRLIEEKHDHRVGKQFTCYIFPLTNRFTDTLLNFK